MLSSEKKAAFSIATLFSLRMLGLFMILPVFSPYAHTLSSATPFLIGTTLGIYGLTQALFQLPFGALSDYYGRKNIIMLGFLIFIMGSFLAAFSHSIYGVMAGRALQGAGAVGSTLIALLTDLTRPEKRAKAMALMGIMIGFSFFISMILGPVLNQYISIQGIFGLTGIFGILAVIFLYTLVPTVEKITASGKMLLSPTWSGLKQNFTSLFFDKQLSQLNIGIFCLHTILTAAFVVLPLRIPHWTSYLLPLIISFILMFGLIGFAEKTKKVFELYFIAIFGLTAASLLLSNSQQPLGLCSLGLTLFLLCFNLLEANLPSLISRLVKPEIKGTAIGIYSTCQFIGIFAGGVLGGWLYQQFSASRVLFSCAMIGVIWLILSLIIFWRRRNLWHAG